jgi:4-amino-4-deoxy-L-arabinose transferase-like glycosyltransferase
VIVSVRINPETYQFDGRAASLDIPRLQCAEQLGRSVLDRALMEWSRSWKLAKGFDEQLVILQTHFHLTELLDGALVQVAAGAVEPARLQLRGAFEALLTVEFITQADSVQRGYAWLVVKDILQRIKLWRAFGTATPLGNALRQTAPPNQVVTAQEAAEKADRLEAMLKGPRWKEAFDEYKQVQREYGRKNVAWWELFGGPKGSGLNTLAEYLNRSPDYYILYRHWSQRVHGSDVVQRFKREGVPALRDTSDLATTINLLTAFALAAMRALFRYYKPHGAEEEYAKWYVEEVRPKWIEFSPLDAG